MEGLARKVRGGISDEVAVEVTVGHKNLKSGVSAEGTHAKALGLESAHRTQLSDRRPVTKNGEEEFEEENSSLDSKIINNATIVRAV